MNFRLRNIIFTLLIIILACFIFYVSIQKKEGRDYLSGETFINPILPGFYPDPGICRAGDDFYLITSTFGYYPGIPVFNSKDPVNRRQAGHVIDRPGQLDLDGLGISCGIFAPTISYYNGTFYVVSTCADCGGNFVVTSDKPECSLSEPVWLPDVTGIDPSLFFDDDNKAYISI